MGGGLVTVRMSENEGERERGREGERESGEEQRMEVSE